MLGYITGSILTIYGVIVSYTSKKSIEDKNNEKLQSCDNIHAQNNIYVRVYNSYISRF